MKKCLHEKSYTIKKPPVFIVCFFLLCFSDLSFAKGTKISLKSTSYKADREAKIYLTTVKGKVVDNTTGEVLPGVSVKVKGSTAGSITDLNGKFTLEIPEGATLIFSFIGYNSVELAIQGTTSLTIRMKASTNSLNEVVVVGYGTQKKSSVTASISTLKVADIAQKPVVNVTNSLVGRVSGVIGTQGSGEPGQDGSGIQIRGVGSIGGSSALTIVDGVPRDFSRLDPNTIATFTVLKDAAAVAPYGVAGANGVILITTKQGVIGKPLLTYNGYTGIQNPTKVPTFVSGYEFAQMTNEAYYNDFKTTGVPFSDADLKKFQDHSDPDVHANAHPLQDIIKPNRILTVHNLSLSGGSENFKYFTSLGYTHQNGMWNPTYLDKYNATINLTANPSKTTTVNFTLNSSVEDQHYPSQSAGTIIHQAQRETPNVPVRYSNGLSAVFQAQSLYGEIYNSGYTSNEYTNIQSQFSISQKLPIKGLSLKGVLSYDLGPDPLFNNRNGISRTYVTPIPVYNVQTNVSPYTYAFGIQGSPKPSFSETYYQNHSFDYQGILDYKTTFGKSELGFTGVVDARRVKYETFTASRINYNVAFVDLDYGGPSTTDLTNGGSSSGQKQIGYVYRADYAYARKYLFQLSGRYDGSYLFAQGKRFGFFPAASAGWVVSKENFMNNIPWIDLLKLRGSYGVSGAYPTSGGNIQTYQYLNPSYSLTGNSAVINGLTTQGVTEGIQGNPNITWEKAKKLDVGFDMSLWKGTLSIEADYFDEKRSNMLIPNSAALPGEYGVGTGLLNAGIMSNHGVDFTIRAGHTFSNDLRLDVAGTFTYAKNKLLSFIENASTYNNPNRRQTGLPYGTQFGYKALGYYKPEDFVDPTISQPVLKPGIPTPTFGNVRPGDLKYADLSGPNGVPDGKIDINDQTSIGKTQTPGIIYGLEPRVSFKHFDLDLLFQGTGNSNIALSDFIAWPFQTAGSATELSFTEHWQPNRTNTLYPRLSSAPTANNTQPSSWWIRNDSYLRLKSAELGYTFNNKMLHNSIQSLRIYVAGQNIFTWTPYMREIIDPENSGTDQNYYQQRVLSIGISATF